MKMKLYGLFIAKAKMKNSYEENAQNKKFMNVKIA